jgi:hypothetical protein
MGKIPDSSRQAFPCAALPVELGRSSGPYGTTGRGISALSLVDLPKLGKDLGRVSEIPRKYKKKAAYAWIIRIIRAWERYPGW